MPMPESACSPCRLHAAHCALALALLLTATGPALASDPSAASFQHGDWELTCDNTRTCRADGYQSEDDANPVSVLLTRAAGPDQKVKGELTLGEPDGEDDEDASRHAPASFAAAMTIDGKPLGSVRISTETMQGTLSEPQVQALLAALTRKSSPAWSAHGTTWRLSGVGAAAVLLKMDDYQGRVGTRGALIRKGPASEERVLPALPAPVVVAVKPLDQATHETPLPPADLKRLRAALLATVKSDDCDLPGETPDEAPIAIARLDAHHQLVEMLCWRGAYQEGNGYWVTALAPPWQPVLVTAAGSEYADGEISASFKGRGLGDCWSNETWAWDGRRFIHTGDATTGLCRMVTLGGTWDLPTLVTDVRHAK